jgi:hypothetical protein
MTIELEITGKSTVNPNPRRKCHLAEMETIARI